MHPRVALLANVIEPMLPESVEFPQRRWLADDIARAVAQAARSYVEDGPPTVVIEGPGDERA